MDISFDCEECGQHIVIDAAGAGLSVRCPICSHDLIVPFPSSQAAKPPELQRTALETTSLGLATEKQKAYLKDLGVTFNSAQLTKEEASQLIEDALSERPPTQRQIEKLRRLGRLDELEDGDTALDASAVLEDVLLDSPTESQLVRVNELGLTIKADCDFNAGELDDILKLADRQPDAEILDEIRNLGIEWTPRTTLEARMVLDLASEFSRGDWSCNAVAGGIARACCAALKDDAFCRPSIDNSLLGLQCFFWPEAKLREWAEPGAGAIEFYQQATKLTPNDSYTWGILGEAYFDVGKLDEAITAYQQAIRLKPGFSVWLNLAIAYDKSGRTVDAEAAFMEAKRLSPELFTRFVEAAKGGARSAEVQRLYPKLFK